MVISELQIALIGAGAAAIAIVWAYNAWQETKHRKTADKIFKGGQGDALLGDEPAAPADDGRREPMERHEPSFSAPENEPSDVEADPEAQAPIAAPAAEPAATPRAEAPRFAAASDLPGEFADNVADCVLRFSAAEPVPAPAVWAIQNAWTAELSRPLRWLAQGEAGGDWQAVDAHDTGRYRNWAVALQLADRRGPVSDGELARFFDGIAQLALQTGATLELPSRGETVLRAAALDEFCAGVDIQFVLHVVETSGGVFAGTKLRGVAEAARLALEPDGMFRARDAAGGELFTVANLGNERLDPESIKSLATKGLTLSLDVPRVVEGPQAFDRMLATARQLASALGGALVDAQRAPLADAMINAIRAKTTELQARMRDGGIAPGSPRALRLFS